MTVSDGITALRSLLAGMDLALGQIDPSMCRKRRGRRRCKLLTGHACDHDFETPEEYQRRLHRTGAELEARNAEHQRQTVEKIGPLLRLHWPSIPAEIIANVARHGCSTTPVSDVEYLRRQVENAARHAGTNYDELLHAARGRPRLYARIRARTDRLVAEMMREWSKEGRTSSTCTG